MKKEDIVTEKVELTKPYSEDVYEMKPELFLLGSKTMEELEEEYFNKHKELDYTNDKGRIRNVYGTTGKTMNAKRLKKTWEAFKETELDEFINLNDLITVQDIFDVGIDKFIYSLGVDSPKNVRSWRTHVVRLGVCPECKNEFVPMMIQTNGGVCIKCATKFSFDALRQFIKNETQVRLKKEDYSVEKDSPENVLMQVMIMFQKSPLFRSMFKKDTPFVEDLLKEQATEEKEKKEKAKQQQLEKGKEEK